ncbi:Uncharacterised protein [Klebsiella oxytoca]|nr:Uncharacterised protein [Klebsiella oxytoca]SBL48689.1 Uncharacterised protein [Klebsiella oxytoca]SBM17739.1 Uncharacterised protein [Klebsiella oxytoca]
MHQYVGVIFTRGGLFQDRHQFVAVRHKESLQILPFMQRGNERANFPVTRLMVSQQLKLIAAMEIQQPTARQATFVQAVELVQGKNSFDKILTQRRIVQATVLFYR